MKRLSPARARELRPAASQPPPLSLQRIATVLEYRVGETIYFQERDDSCWYRLLTGAARECALTPDGRRQIVGFLLPGDLFGLLRRGARGLAGEIICDAVLECFPRARAEALAESDPRVARQIREMTFAALERTHARALLVGCGSALEKVSAFLVEMAARTGIEPGQPIPLPMSRYDIADYLGLAVETVSRAFTTLRKQHAITFEGTRRIRVVNEELVTGLGAATLPPLMPPPVVTPRLRAVLDWAEKRAP